MEIHELNTFSGNLGAGDFFATDNGTDTSKVSADSMFGPLNARIDNIIAGGTAPSAAEVTDARLGATVLGGIQYASLGDSVRGQATKLFEQNTDLKRDIKEYNAYNILPYIGTFRTVTHNGITFSWNNDHSICTMNGTASGSAFTNLYYNLTSLPDGIEAGGVYRAKVAASVFGKISLTFIGYDSNANIVLNKNRYGDGLVTIPSNCVGLIIRLIVVNGASLSNATASVALLNAISNDELMESVENIEGIRIEVPNDSVPASGTSAGVTFSWVNGGKSCNVTGQSTGTSFNNIINYTNNLPSQLEYGKSYYLDFDSTDENIYVEFLAYNDGVFANGRVWRINKPGYFTIPSQATKFGIRLRVLNNVSVNGTISNIRITESAPNNEKINHLSSYTVPYLVSFVDDDTTNDDYVTKYYQNCKHNGVVGNYAVMTLPIDNGDTSANKLIAYENDGFGMLIHCHDQRGDATNYWKPENRDLTLCRENLAIGLRKMDELGFINFKYWVTPYGVKDAEMVSLARFFGLKCLASYDDIDANYTSNLNRYQIQRISFRPTDNTYRSSLAGVKSIIDGFKNSPYGGWLIITTHFNEWGNLAFDETLDSDGYPIGYSRFNELVEYVINSGCAVVPFQEGFSYIEPYLSN